MQRSPAFVVPSVDITPALYQKLHHLSIFINASLPEHTHTMQLKYEFITAYIGILLVKKIFKHT